MKQAKIVLEILLRVEPENSIYKKWKAVLVETLEEVQIAQKRDSSHLHGNPVAFHTPVHGKGGDDSDAKRARRDEGMSQPT